MKLLFLFIIFFNIGLAQDTEGDSSGGSDNYFTNPANFQDETIKGALIAPKKKVIYPGPRKTYYQFSLGQNFYRFDPVEGDNKTSSFSKDGYVINFKTYYYLFNWIAPFVNIDYSSFSVERYDGRALSQSDKSTFFLGGGLQFDLIDFQISISRTKRRAPIYIQDTSTLYERDFKSFSTDYRIGHRTKISSFIIELFIQYSSIDEFEDSVAGKVTGNEQSIGVEIFTSKSKAFGLHICDTSGEFDIATSQSKYKKVLIMPFYRF